MVKGTQRQMVMVRTSESELFEMAYFVLRADTRKSADERSMIAEANSIVCATCGDKAYSKKEKRRSALRRTGLFIIGALSGASLAAVILFALGVFR